MRSAPSSRKRERRDLSIAITLFSHKKEQHLPGASIDTVRAHFASIQAKD